MVDLSHINCLCFSGGGLKGLSITGALQCLCDQQNIDFGSRTQPLHTCAGTSIGAIFALLITIGYTVTELSIFSHYFFSLTNLWRLSSSIDKYSLADGNEIRKLLIKLLQQKGIAETITFEELYEITHTHLIVVAIDVESRTGEYLGVDEKSDLSVLDAVCASAAIPLIFPAVECNTKKYIDGGCFDNFPITLLPKETTLGFYIQSDEKVASEAKLMDRLIDVYNAFDGFRSQMHWELLSNRYKKNIIILYIPYNITPLGDGTNNRDIVVRAGYTCASEFLEGKQKRLQYSEGALPHYFLEGSSHRSASPNQDGNPHGSSLSGLTQDAVRKEQKN